ncbi:hypothetical protein ABAC460_13340 [Asticcacaulis sp. AC460]|nr:hypothetical protein ABAC460_13340 [Asticcacaulis sp. AC460]
MGEAGQADMFAVGRCEIRLRSASDPIGMNFRHVEAAARFDSMGDAGEEQVQV